MSVSPTPMPRITFLFRQSSNVPPPYRPSRRTVVPISGLASRPDEIRDLAASDDPSLGAGKRGHSSSGPTSFPSHLRFGRRAPSRGFTIRKSGRVLELAAPADEEGET